MIKLKIAGVVNDYNYAVEIEEIVKVFIIKQRINALFSLEKNKKYIKNDRNHVLFSQNEIKLLDNSNQKTSIDKNKHEFHSNFLVRGLF